MADEDFAPILDGPGQSDYERYLRTDELLALQKSESEMAHRDELLFQTVHQSSELWLKHACIEIETAARLVDDASLGAATRVVARGVLGIELITAQLSMLARLSPWEYQEIRKVLGHGSGFDSPGFVEIKRVTPLLGQAFSKAVRSAGASLEDVYRDAPEHPQLYDLAESMVDWDEALRVWRYRHLTVVERIIGNVVGTQGTPVDQLRKLIGNRYYPDLWQVRTRLTDLAGT
jgi:tryptophan 2,3-dioxygenase